MSLCGEEGEGDKVILHVLRRGGNISEPAGCSYFPFPPAQTLAAEAVFLKQSRALGARAVVLTELVGRLISQIWLARLGPSADLVSAAGYPPNSAKEEKRG